ncbi:4-hydroxy-tetrahydrodipicolinate reductase [Rickettsiales bacterium LUAb2]
MKIGILGCCGRVGRNLLKEIYYTNPSLLSAGLDNASSPLIGTDLGRLIDVNDIGISVSGNMEEVFAASDVLIDFTVSSAAIDHIKYAAKVKKPIVVGTTGFNDKQEALIKKLAEQIVIVKSSNMSLGMNVLFQAVEYVASILLANNYDIEIVEKHHRSKIDAPSGSALTLGNIVAKANGDSLQNLYHSPRKGISNGREKGKIAFHAIRGGDLIGEHSVMFIGDGESIELKHTATSRNIFVGGALKAAKWALTKEKGLYAFSDVISK